MKRLGATVGRFAALVVASGALLLLPAPSASAHPLGNFTINHYDGLVFSTSDVTNHAVIDTAEIPTLSAKDDVDADGSGEADSAERAAYARSECGVVADGLELRVGGRAVAWQVGAATFAYRPGQAGLDVSRLECELSADVDLASATEVTFEDRYLAQRIGWREITAVGRGVDLGERDVATRSVSDELRSYPNDLLSSPLDQRDLDLQVQPGEDSGGGALPQVEDAGPVSTAINSLTTRLDSLVGGRLTWTVGVAAVLLSLVLGASHAALPGHGKTLMAAYMVGTRGSPRDAVLIGATVTLAHTSGVLVLGLLFSVGTSWAGETVLAVLGVISGLLVASIGIALVRSALRRRSAQVDELWGHGHDRGHGHGHGHGHGPGHGHGDHSHEHAPEGEHQAEPVQTIVLAPESTAHSHSAHHDNHRQERGFRRLTLVGMGLAGGLVPSPSALIVLLGAIALGRTVFGIGLVLAYGIGMAGTLTTVGYLVAKLPGRLGGLRMRVAGTRLGPILAAGPVLTAIIVLFVGVALALRSAGPLV